MPLAGGFPDILRNVAGLTGIGLLCATLLGGAARLDRPACLPDSRVVRPVHRLAPAHPEHALDLACPPHDVGGALCAAVVFAAGLAAITLRGPRVPASGDGPG